MTTDLVIGTIFLTAPVWVVGLIGGMLALSEWASSPIGPDEEHAKTQG